MATAYLTGDRYPVITRSDLTGAAALLANLDRSAIASAVEALVNLLDVLDGDPDAEANGDELDGNGAEDDFCDHNTPLSLEGPGCPIADPDTAIDDNGCDGDTDREPEDGGLWPQYAEDQSAGPLPVSPSTDRFLMKPHLHRLRATRCERFTYGGTNGGYRVTEYRLRDEPGTPRTFKATEL